MTQQPDIPRPDQDPAEPWVGQAWQHTPDPLTDTAPAVRESYTARAQARLACGAGRLWTASSAFIRGAGLDLGERAKRWAVGGIAAFVIEQILAADPAAAALCAGGSVLAVLVACWRYGAHDAENAQLGNADRRELAPTALLPGPDQDPALVDDLDAPLDLYWPPDPADTFSALAPNSAYQITAMDDGSTVVRVLDHLDRPVPSSVRHAVAELSMAQVAEDALRAALAAPRVSLSFTEVTGGPTSHGQRYRVTLHGGATVADVIGKLANLESAWGVPHGGAVYATPDEAGNKNQIIITRLDTDPLTTVRRTQRLEFGTVSVKDPVLVGYVEDGSPDFLTLLRRNVGIIAANRAGKSTLHWNILNHLTACQDAVYWLIDLQGSAALRTWAPTAGMTAWTLTDARTLLRAAFAFAQYRANQLGANAEAFIHGDGDTLDVNHEPTAKDPALVIFVDEGSLLAGDKECVELMLDITRTGPKAAVTLKYANQRGTDDATGSASLRKEFGEKFMLRCEESDVDQFLGKDLRQSGWAPHRISLQGVYYHLNLIDGGRQSPRRARTTWPDPGEMKAGIRAAIGRRPRFDPASTRLLPIAVQSETFPEAINAIAAQCAVDGADRISTGDLATRLAERDPRRWKAADVVAEMRALGQETSSIRTTSSSETKARGYYLTQLESTHDAIPGADLTTL